MNMQSNTERLHKLLDTTVFNMQSTQTYFAPKINYEYKTELNLKSWVEIKLNTQMKCNQCVWEPSSNVIELS